jgi:hypothetical protein
MFSDSENLLKPDVVCMTEIIMSDNFYYGMRECNILFDTHIEDYDIKMMFVNPEIHYKDNVIFIVGTSNLANEKNTGYMVLIKENSKIPYGKKLIAKIKKANKKIDIFIEDVQQLQNHF